MYELITDKTLAEYEAFLQSHPKGHFAQSSLWAKQKPMWTWDAVAVRGEDGKIKGSLALMTRRVPGIGRTLMYGCRGPVCDLDDRAHRPARSPLLRLRSQCHSTVHGCPSG